MMDHTLVIVTQIFIENDFILFFKIVEIPTPDLNVMEWPQPCPLLHYWGGGCIAKLALTSSTSPFPDIMGKGLTIPYTYLSMVG